jgi:hypothetical protein
MIRGPREEKIMKKIAIILAALAAAFAVSCTKEAPEAQLPQDQNVPAGMKMVTINASVEGADTKTSYDAGKFSWTKGDKISVRCIDGSSNRKYFTFTANETGPSVTFTGSIPEDYTLEAEAFFPASEEHYWESWQPYYNIPMYRPMYIGDDSKGRLSADIPMFAKATDGVYNFTHMCGAALLTFTNFPDFITKAKVSIVNSALKISGTFKVSYSGANSEYMTWNSASAANDSEKTYIREVPVENNQTQLYLPYHGELWAASTISIIGYDAAGVEYTLLNGKSMKGNSTRFERGVVQPYAPLALPDYVPEADLSKIDWNAENVKLYDLPGKASSSRQALRQVKVVADKYYVYARLVASAEYLTATSSDYFGLFIYDAIDGAGDGYYGWNNNAAGNNEYNGEHAGTLNITDYSVALTVNKTPVDVTTQVSGDEIVWMMAIPRSAHASLTSAGSAYFTFLTYAGWTPSGSVPEKYDPMLEVTLP